MRGVDIDEYEFDLLKVAQLRIKMNTGQWDAEDYRKQPLGVHHQDINLISGHEIVLAFLSSKLESIEVYLIDNV